MKASLFLAAAGAALLATSAAFAAPILNMSDFIVAIDVDPDVVPISDYPATEGPFNAFDLTTAAKYLNFGERNSGLIVTPGVGATTLRSLVLTTANDAVERDPASYKIWGTNDPIVTLDNDNGPNAENWSLITEGAVALPAARQAVGPVISFANSTAYSSYRITFPTVKNFTTANSMQIGEIGLFQGTDGVTNRIAIDSAVDPILAILLDPIPVPNSNHPVAEASPNILDWNYPRPDLPSQSAYAATEGPANLFNGTAAAKYLNGGSDDAGFIVTPAAGSSTIKSFQLTTANDVVDRDPTSYELYGTNAPIASPDNSYGTSEPWTLISSGALTLPFERLTAGEVVPVTNLASYASYKMVFPTRVGPAAGFQLAEASFFPDTLGAGTDILNPGDAARAIDATIRTGVNTKYLNFGEENSGFIVTPAVGAKVVTGFQIITANDADVRDPTSYEIYGTNDAVTSTDNSTGSAENWTLISSGSLDLPFERLATGDLVTFANTTAYKSYKVVFPTVRDVAAANSMQIASFQLYDNTPLKAADFNEDGKVDGGDFLTWQQNLGATGATKAMGDATGDGNVNGADLAQWKTQFATAVAATGAVPEPAGAVVAIGLLGGLARRRRW